MKERNLTTEIIVRGKLVLQYGARESHRERKSAPASATQATWTENVTGMNGAERLNRDKDSPKKSRGKETRFRKQNPSRGNQRRGAAAGGNEGKKKFLPRPQRSGVEAWWRTAKTSEIANTREKRREGK